MQTPHFPVIQRRTISGVQDPRSVWRLGSTHRQLLLQAVVEVLGLVGLKLLQGDPSLADELVVPEFVLVTHGNPVTTVSTGIRLNTATATGRTEEAELRILQVNNVIR